MKSVKPSQTDQSDDTTVEVSPGFTSLSCLMSSPTSDDRSADGSPSLPGHDEFEQYVTQADIDRDPFAVALFEVKPIDLDNSKLLEHLGQTLLQFASPTTHVAYLGRNRFGLLSHTDDTTQRWVAPATTALRVALDCWSDEDDGRSIDVSDLTGRPTLMTGMARGLSREAWVNAEQALARAYKQRIPVAEYESWEPVPGHDRADETFDSAPILARGIDDPSASAAAAADTVSSSASIAGDMPADDRLVVLSRRIEPVDRPEPIWHWLRLMPGLRPHPSDEPTPIQLAALGVADQALIEVWLANQVVGLFAEASAQLRVSIPLSAEACRSRSFAQRIFPLLEQFRLPPSRLVVEIDMSAVARHDATTPRALVSPSAPSVERFIRDAAAVNVAVAITGFNGGWSAWYNLADLPVDYLVPSPEMMYQAGQGDHGAIRSLVLLAAEADERGIELIAPAFDSGLSVHALTQIGFSYGEGELSEARQALPTDSTADRDELARS